MGESLIQGLKNLLDVISSKIEQMNLSNNLRDNDGFNKAYQEARIGVLGLQVGFEALTAGPGPSITIDAQIEDIAATCHELNKSFCEAYGDYSQPDWKNAPEWQKNSAIDGVTNILNEVVIGPEDSHVSWMKQKEVDGWKYGPVKDPEKKEHPCMVPFEELPREQQYKDVLFYYTTLSLLERAGLLKEESTTMDDVPTQVPEEIILPEKQNDTEPSPMDNGSAIKTD